MQKQSFPSSSSSSATSLDLKNSKKIIIGVLRRLFCFRGLPEYSLDGPPKEDFSLEAVAAMAPAPTRTQGVVATLMGLQPMLPQSVSRRPKFDEFAGACFELENEEFLILTFSRKVRKGSKFTETGIGGSNRQRRSKKQRDVQRFPKEISLKTDSDCMKLNNFSRIHHTRKRDENEDSKLVKEAGRDCSTVEITDLETTSENLSPVSVLDCDKFLTHILGGELTSGEAKLSSNLAILGERSLTEGKAIVDKKEENKRKYFLKKWSEIWRVAAMDTATDLNWVNGSSLVWEIDDICADFGMQILDETLGELIDEFVIQLIIFA